MRICTTNTNLNELYLCLEINIFERKEMQMQIIQGIRKLSFNHKNGMMFVFVYILSVYTSIWEAIELIERLPTILPSRFNPFLYTLVLSL